ncbi:LCP family protein [Lysinibacillus sp. BW-2-10]|uniref:LCP family glycopolymer transferase n=1 Tax=Lysinibacillus sp. BW-2-10 TaxID=2590030 RepID=UPI00117D3111|nr:LCP family protein [Lysinibacillus sp. BW-2-10]TSI07350.1 LytR family transcriptional regulator [Lysinibacillus sp. BW-2-10]
MPKWLTRKKLILIMIAFFLFLVIGYAAYLFFNFQSTMKAIHSPITIEETSTTRPIIQEKEDPISNEPTPITLLLLGVDQFEDAAGRADTILVLTVNPQTETMKMLSIPRDTYTEIIGLDFSDKINHSYAFGGVTMAHQTVENLLQIPIDYVVSINMEGFIELVDLLGGVEVENEVAFSTDYNDYPKGEITISGDAALDYVRMRYEDPLGDFGRQIRQRLVIESLLNRLSSLNIVWQVPSVLETVRDHVETNVTFDDITYFLKSYKPALNNIEQISFVEGEGRLEDGIWYYFASEDELQQIRDELKAALATK